MIEGFEIGSKADYDPQLTWPGGASGITAGVGSDLGYMTAAEITQIWHELAPADLAQMVSYAGVCGADAEAMVGGAANISISYAIAERVFRAIEIPDYIAITLATFPNSNLLSDDSLGALVSLVFNRGPSMTDFPAGSGNRREMRAIRDAIATKYYASVPGFMLSMRRLWVNRNLGGLLKRRVAEAQLFTTGLTIGFRST